MPAWIKIDDVIIDLKRVVTITTSAEAGRLKMVITLDVSENGKLVDVIRFVNRNDLSVLERALGLIK